MTEKQEHLLQLFRELDEICKKNNLRYVMAGGTAIGVVRNEGFIPWDDDVDIYMPRDDWNKLVEISGSVLPEHRALQCVDVDRSYTNTFPRYVATDSCALHKHQIIGRDSAGEIIDVLTLDPIPADDKEYEKMIKTGKGSYGGYTYTFESGDGDFLTADTLLDFKVSKSKPTNKHNLQLLMY